jgi:hypothetical protein
MFVVGSASSSFLVVRGDLQAYSYLIEREKGFQFGSSFAIFVY